MHEASRVHTKLKDAKTTLLPVNRQNAAAFVKSAILTRLCKKLTILAVITDYENCNEKALLELDTMANSASWSLELALVVLLPDVVHIGKSLKCSWSN